LSFETSLTLGATSDRYRSRKTISVCDVVSLSQRPLGSQLRFARRKAPVSAIASQPPQQKWSAFSD
jgi:hypothetical protein